LASGIQDEFAASDIAQNDMVSRYRLTDKIVRAATGSTRNEVRQAEQDFRMAVATSLLPCLDGFARLRRTSHSRGLQRDPIQH
jgi:hypothetical protein